MSDHRNLGPGPRDLAALAELLATGIDIVGEVQVAESTWVVYGHSGYDGGLIVGEYHAAGEAAAVLRAVPRLQVTTAPG